MISLTREEIIDQLKRLGIHTPSEAVSVAREYRWYYLQHNVLDDEYAGGSYLQRVLSFLKRS